MPVSMSAAATAQHTGCAASGLARPSLGYVLVLLLAVALVASRSGPRRHTHKACMHQCRRASEHWLSCSLLRCGVFLLLGARSPPKRVIARFMPPPPLPLSPPPPRPARHHRTVRRRKARRRAKSMASAPRAVAFGACDVHLNTSWGLPARPDALGHKEGGDWAAATEHQQLAPCLRVRSAQACCSTCSATLGCIAWTLLPSNGSFHCCMRQWLPQGWFPASGAMAGTVKEPCEADCRLPTPVKQLFGPKPHVRVEAASMADLPWLAVAHGRPPEPSRETRHAELAQPNVAVCLAGQTRTLVHPLVWSSLNRHVLEEGRYDLFAVLGTGSSMRSRLPRGARTESGAWEDRSPDACALEAALSTLRPIAVRFITTEGRSAPCHTDNAAFASIQFAKWAQCTDLVEAHEPERGRKYGWIFKTRPDIYWRRPLHLGELAASMPSRNVVLTCNDLHLLVHRSRIGVLSSMTRLKCDRRCHGGSPVLKGFFHSHNEYCLLMMHLAELGVRHLEVSHPSEKAIMHYVSASPWTARFRVDRPLIVRSATDQGVGKAPSMRTICEYHGQLIAQRRQVRCWEAGAASGDQDMRLALATGVADKIDEAAKPKGAASAHDRHAESAIWMKRGYPHFAWVNVSTVCEHR